MKRDHLFSTILIYFCCQCVYFQLDLHTILRIKYENIYLWLVLRSITIVKINIERLLFDLFIGYMNNMKASNQWFSRYSFCSALFCCALFCCVVLCCAWVRMVRMCLWTHGFKMRYTNFCLEIMIYLHTPLFTISFSNFRIEQIVFTQ